MKNKTANDNYYLLTMAALAQEFRFCQTDHKAKVILAAGLPLISYRKVI